ncbi:MAG TPA: hypothetical protein VGO18_24705 [Steroidobacteraceae bacterium]|nr:hypothetical protein [Steroidobacteraceae bacterium]
MTGALTFAGLPFNSRATSSDGSLSPRSVAVDGLANPEDLAIIPGTDWIITSASPSEQIKKTRSFFVNTRTQEARPAYPDNCTFDLDRERFGDIALPEAVKFHGLDVVKAEDGTLTLYQVNHALNVGPAGHTMGRESIEVFQIAMTPHGPSLRWRGAIPVPSWVVGNDCCALPEGGVAVTNTSFGGMEGFPMMATGKSSGQVLEWHDRKQGWSVVEGTDVNAPNGTAISSQGKYFFICSTATKQLHRISRSNPHGDRVTIDVGTLADNITWTLDRQLLVAGHVAELDTLMKSVHAGKLGGVFRATKVDPITMKSKVLLEASVSNCIVSTALQTGEKEIWLGDIGLENKLLVYSI